MLSLFGVGKVRLCLSLLVWLWWAVKVENLCKFSSNALGSLIFIHIFFSDMSEICQGGQDYHAQEKGSLKAGGFDILFAGGCPQKVLQDAGYRDFINFWNFLVSVLSQAKSY